MQARSIGAGVAALTFACLFSLVAINERASHSPTAVLAQAGPQYQALPSFHDKQGTNRAFLHKYDGKGQSTKAPTQMLASILGSGEKRREAQQQKMAGREGFVPLPDAGGMGTNKAFVNKGDGQGLRGTSKLSGFGTDKAFLHKYDGKGQSTKGKMQQLYEWTGGKLV